MKPSNKLLSARYRRKRESRPKWKPSLGTVVGHGPYSGNGIYVVMLLRPVSGEPTADGHEVDHAAYFTLNQIRELNPLPPVNWEIARLVLDPTRCLLLPKPLTNLNGAKFTLFVGYIPTLRSVRIYL